MSDKIIDVFTKGELLEKLADAKQGLATADNARFLRLWHEVSMKKCGFDYSSREKAKTSGKKWFPYNKGGSFRRWYGNQDYLVNWEDDGYEIKKFYGENGRLLSRPQNTQFYFRESASWSKVTSGDFCLRYFQPGFIFDVAGCSIFTKNHEFLLSLIGAMNSPVMDNSISAISPTLNYEVGQISAFPVLPNLVEGLGREKVEELIDLSKQDWDSFETSWNFAINPLLNPSLKANQGTINFTYHQVRNLWRDKIMIMRDLEEMNNQLFLTTYGLENEIDFHVPIEKISITNNASYRYGGNYSEDDLEKRLLEDTIKEFISYAIGCTFGRYSLDKPGLILANQGETIEDYYKTLSLTPDPALTPSPSSSGRGDGSLLPRAEWHQATSAKYKGSGEQESLLPLGEGQDEGKISQSQYSSRIDEKNILFPPTETNVIPIVEGEWFADGAAARFKQFLRVTFGEENYAENLRFIEDTLGKDIQKYFLRDFYKDHVQTYKKRPIYWLFSSPKGSFNALIYMHRYTPETVSVVLNQYLREYRDKLTAHRANLERISASASARDKSQALKEIEDITKILAELKEYENEVLYPLASQQIQIDLDDGVVVNYAKFGEALKQI